MNHTALKFRALDRDRARRGLPDDLNLISYGATSGYAPLLTVKAGWSAKRVSRFTLGQEFFEIRIAEYGANGPRQTATATIVGLIPIDGGGDVSVVVTALGMTHSPKIVSVTVADGDNASAIAGKIRAALTANADVGNVTTGFFIVSGTTDKVKLTAKVAAAIDTTMNIATDNDTSTGLTPDPTSESGLAEDLTPIFDRNLSHAQIADRYHKVVSVLEPKRETRVWLVRTSPTGQRKPA